MSTVVEIESALETLPTEQWLEIRRWMDDRLSARRVTTVKPMPDFLARQRALFGGRVLPDSQGVLDEVRADRF